MKVDVGENRIKRRIPLPHLGQRIMKTALAVFLCLIIYMLRGYDGMVTQSTVAAIICIQPFRSDTLNTSIRRVIGTLIGAGWGLLFLWGMSILTGQGIILPMPFVYLIMAVGIVVSLYTTVVIRKTDAADLAAIVFICIVATYPDLEAPLAQTFDRIIDTMVGIIVAGLVNRIALPRTRHDEYMFFIRLQDLVPDRYSRVNHAILVMLNRLYDEGAKICLISKWAPAFMLSQMGTMDIKVPCIVMDGAALYDIPNRRYLNVISIPFSDAYFLKNILQNMGLGYGIYTVRESSLMIYRGGSLNRAEAWEYDLMKRSPYRNYVEGHLTEEDQVAFVRVIDTDEKIEKLEQKIRFILPGDRFRIVRRHQHRMEGFSGLYFYHPQATVENSKAFLMDYMSKITRTSLVRVDMVMHETYRSDNEAVALLNKTRNIYEPLWRPRLPIRDRHK